MNVGLISIDRHPGVRNVREAAGLVQDEVVEERSMRVGNMMGKHVSHHFVVLAHVPNDELHRAIDGDIVAHASLIQDPEAIESVDLDANYALQLRRVAHLVHCEGRVRMEERSAATTVMCEVDVMQRGGRDGTIGAHAPTGRRNEHARRLTGPQILRRGTPFLHSGHCAAGKNGKNASML